MIHPVEMACMECGTRSLVEVPETLMPYLDNLLFSCGDCFREAHGGGEA